MTYEDRTAEPEKSTRGLCEYLGVPWESGMLDYVSKDHGVHRPRLGDWSGTLKSGRVQPARTADPATELPYRLRELAGRGGTRRGHPHADAQPVKPAVMDVNCQVLWLMPEQLLTTPPPAHGRSRFTAQ
ncbi:hypothetical protein [Streptomyces sp. NPDC002276]